MTNAKMPAPERDRHPAHHVNHNVTAPSECGGGTVPPTPDRAAAAVPPVGPLSGAELALVGALLWAAPADYDGALALVRPDDFESCAVATVFDTIRRLAESGRAHSPELVLDELRRVGRLTPELARVLASAATCGASPGACRQLAAAVVAGAWRRRVESAGRALADAADTSAEPALVALVERAVAAIRATAARLEKLRGGGELGC